ncbi:Protein farnesyltransferase/geranylgeranyltransferase type-1 subunit alpha [Pleurostoma richardsiae]|uniref:Protein farnesyltransferase/geranylgeranyltransferase type-1 subunit alpha n=1 Tax=Pleurostoma richardsiae TaxID=41990 RepID=A0AA38RR47_9PEZI|nr:Protein farnesyltransferase/geranylgeranyltransferase type-1 subunit alpha [Pleurostoma richardsiae]
MPPKSKAGSKQKEPETKAPPPPPPRTVKERSQRIYTAGHPYAASLHQSGPSGLTPAERTAWIASAYLRQPASALRKLGARAQKDVWKHVNESGLPPRSLKSPPGPHTWGTDRSGRDVGEYAPEEFAARTEARARLACLRLLQGSFRQRWELAKRGALDPDTKEVFVVGEDEVDEERGRRKEIATLRMELYGERTGPYALDPEWDDVVPIPIEEGEGALAAIAYPEDYAEAISYLRAVMAKQEYSARSLRLTEHVISMNPAHYTVWLYRFAIVSAMGIPIPEEIEWLNEVALENLKNYQIWHHRRLLLDHYYPSIASDPQAVRELAASEERFLSTILAEDTKNYHVWSYRQYLVPKLGLFTPEELASTARLIDDDVRNNSAWSHRFFLIFSDPAHSTPGSHSTEHDPRVPVEVVEREVAYAQDKIRLAPQNQSPWNYLRGVLVKGGWELGRVEEFAAGFVKGVGGLEDREEVRSTHALDLLAEMYAEKGDVEKADLYLRRLAEKWDRIRAGYWGWRRKMLKDAK